MFMAVLLPDSGLTNSINNKKTNDYEKKFQIFKKNISWSFCN